MLAGKMLQITVITVAVSLFFSPVSKTLIAYEKFVLSKCVDIVRIVVRVGLCCIALTFGGKGIAIVSINLLTTAGVGIFSMIAIIIHNIPEGIATFLTTTSNLNLGLKLTIAIALHNIPEGLFVLIVAYKGYALGVTVNDLSACPEKSGAGGALAGALHAFADSHPNKAV